MSIAPEFFYPPEWAPHEACWLAWPWNESLWEEDLGKAQNEFAELCRAIRGEKLHILVNDEKAEVAARKALADLSPKFFRIPYSDIWLRDTAPIFLLSSENDLATAQFLFNGWGEKYILLNDDQVAYKIGKSFSSNRVSHFFYPWVLEGGSLEVDEFGTCLTTEQCLLNSNRNPKFSRSEIESELKESLGFKKILWIKEGLVNDHTDGHIDTLARFAPGGTVICMRAQKDSDPNAKILEEISNQLRQMTNASEEKLRVVEIPSPGEIYDDEGHLMPASFVNFYISNESVVVPQYGSNYDEAAVREISKYYPNRKCVGSSARSILTGGGAFHCITQQQPKAEIK